MKKIYSIILTALAVLAFAPAASAQTPDWSIKGQIKDPKYPGQPGHIIDFPNDTGPKVDTEKNFGYSKNVSVPFSDGTYWIKLESFATGSAEIEDKPSDIVLLLDVSGSMSNSYKSGVNAYIPDADTKFQIFSQNTRYVKYEGNYYQIQLNRLKDSSGNNVAFNQGGYGWLSFKVGSTTYYMDGFGDTDQIRVASDPVNMSDHPVWTGTGNFNNNSVMWGGAVYIYDTNGLTKLEALKEAVVAFIEEIQDNDRYVTKDGVKQRRKDKDGNETTLGNRVSIVKFAYNAFYNDNNPLAEGNHKGAGSNSSNNYTEVVKNYRYVDDNGVAELIAAVGALTSGAHTAADKGMDLANRVLAQPQPSDKPDRVSMKTLVMFTDGDPNHNSGFDTAVANAAINEANKSKNTYKATVFGVAIFPSANTNRTNYMNRISSNYPDATTMSNGTPIQPASARIYYKDAATEDLKDVFIAIARLSGGSGATLSAATSNVDIVSHSFKFPDDVTADNIGSKVKIFTAKLNDIDDAGKYIFDTEILAGHSEDKYKTYDELGNETGEYFVDEHEGTGSHGQGLKVEMVTTPDGNQGVRVTNFDYANNWCGPVTDAAGNVTYQGHEIIILIPIQMNPNAVGGPNVQTNTDGSGIFINENENYIEFKSPTVSLPVNIYIEKTGIEGVESAKFLIERASLPVLPEGQDEYTLQDIQGIPEANWKYVTTVFVTNSDNAQHDAVSGNPVVRVKGLPASEKVGGVQKGLVYRISEETWSWAYNPLGAKYQYTVTGQVNNPFTFENENKNTAIKHAESKVTNIFMDVQTTKVYDDSKDNGR